jgi:hypothetical protein
MEALYKKIEQSINEIEPALDYQEILVSLIELCDLINKTEDTEEWIYIEGNYGSIPDLLGGAYWHLTEWHAGQSSMSYAAMCAIGSIFSPNMSSGPEEGSIEIDIYNMLETLAGDQI